MRSQSNYVPGATLRKSPEHTSEKMELASRPVSRAGSHGSGGIHGMLTRDEVAESRYLGANQNPALNGEEREERDDELEMQDGDEEGAGDRVSMTSSNGTKGAVENLHN